MIWVWSSGSETGKSSFLSHLQALWGEAALKFPATEQYGWQHLLRDHTQLILLDISRADTEDLDALEMPSGQMGQNSFGSVTYSLEDRAQANELASENKRRKGYLSRLCKTLEELSNHSEITNSKNSGSRVQFSGHTVVFSNHSPVDVHARLPKRLLEIVATRDPPPANKKCVLTPVQRPEIKNTACGFKQHGPWIQASVIQIFDFLSENIANEDLWEALAAETEPGEHARYVHVLSVYLNYTYYINILEDAYGC